MFLGMQDFGFAQISLQFCTNPIKFAQSNQFRPNFLLEFVVAYPVPTALTAILFVEVQMLTMHIVVIAYPKIVLYHHTTHSFGTRLTHNYFLFVTVSHTARHGNTLGSNSPSHTRKRRKQQ